MPIIICCEKETASKQKENLCASMIGALASLSGHMEDQT